MHTARSILDAFYDAERVYMSQPPSEADPTAMSATLSPTITLHQSADLPYGGIYIGVSGFLDWSRAMNSLFSQVDVQVNKVLEEGDDVVVLSELRLKVRRTGESVTGPFAQHVKVDREAGVIVEIRPFYWNVGGLNEALKR